MSIGVADPAQRLVAAERAVAVRCPTIAPEVIHDLVVAESEHFADARVRDFVPLLVARAVTERLRAMPASPSIPA